MSAFDDLDATEKASIEGDLIGVRARDPNCERTP